MIINVGTMLYMSQDTKDEDKEHAGKLTIL